MLRRSTLKETNESIDAMYDQEYERMVAEEKGLKRPDRKRHFFAQTYFEAGILREHMRQIIEREPTLYVVDDGTGYVVSEDMLGPHTPREITPQWARYLMGDGNGARYPG